ncbi:MAG: hypothetical protein RLN99_06965 [Kiloniellaceae bacterium]
MTKAAYLDTFGNFDAVAIAAAVPFGLSVLLDLTLPEESAGAALSMVRLFLTTAFAALFEIAWLRRLLLEGPTARPGLVPPISRRFGVFVSYSFLLTALFIPTLFLDVVLVETAEASPVTFGIFIFVLYVAASYLSVRFGLVAPWIALDAPQRLGESWRHTQKNGLRILIAHCLTALPLALLLGVFGIVIAAVSPELAARIEDGVFEGSAFWFVVIGGNALLYLYYALGCAVLAQAFCMLTGWQRGRRELLERFE